MLTFYRDVMGFAEGLMMRSFAMGDVGLEEEQYHVVAFNSWKQTDILLLKIAVGLDFYTLVLSEKKTIWR